jgi:hypothetical protein
VLTASDITAICAVIVAVAALGVSVWEGIANRQHSRLSVRPLLHLEFFNTDVRDVTVTLENNGPGPAIIVEYEVSLVGGNGERQVLDTLNLGDGFKLPYVRVWSPEPGEVVVSGGQKDLICLGDRLQFGSPARAQAIAKLEGAEFHLTYRSLYGGSYETAYRISAGQLRSVQKGAWGERRARAPLE